jgi:heterodisulfide reductase subunit A-like polyferredoxin
MNSVSMPATRKALVISGGITGIQVSADIADAGYEYERTTSPSAFGFQPMYIEIWS